MRLAFLPVALVIALDDHVHTLQHVALRVILEGQDALETQDLRAVFLGHAVDPGEEGLRIQLAGAQGNAADGMRVVMVVMVIVVAVRAADVIMVVIMVMVMVMSMRVMPVIMIVVVMMVMRAVWAAGMVVIMMMVVVVTMIVVMMVVMTVTGVQELRIQRQDAVEIEGTTVQHLGDVDGAALGAVTHGIGVDLVDPRLDGGEFLR